MPTCSKEKAPGKASPGKKSLYADAGVNIDEMMTSLKAVKRMVRHTAVPGVLSELGSFGGMFTSPGRNRVLLASTDGVGTKLKVAAMAGRHKTVGEDLVNHCVNDILVHGAKPLFFLDYFGTARLQGKVFRDVVAGLCRGCRRNGCALLGGETAEMPGLYPEGEYDLVGTVVGDVDRKRVVTGRAIRPGDLIIGLPSSGLHTNGFSLARQVLFEKARLGLDDILPGTRRSVVDILLAVHRSYLKPVTRVMEAITVHGMSHITGGGLMDNVPRILPEGTTAVFDTTSWQPPPVFRFIQSAGAIERDEMYRVFNMGIGYLLIVRKGDAEKTLDLLRDAGSRGRLVGQIQKGARKVLLKT